MIIVQNGIANGKKVDGIPDGKYYDTNEYCIINGYTTGQVRQWKHRKRIDGVVIFGKNYFPESAEPRVNSVGRPAKPFT